MTVIATDSNRLSSIVKWELVPEQGVCRDNVTINAAAATYKVGTVLGKTLTGGTATVTTSVGTPVTFSAFTVAGYAETGVYRMVMTSSTAFNLYRPAATGNTPALIGVGVLGTATVPANAGGLTFTATTAGSPAAGDTYNITVAGTYKFKICEASATDGSQKAAAIYINDVNGLSQDLAVAATTDTQAVAITRGPVIVALGGATYTVGNITVSQGGLSYGTSINTAGLIAVMVSQLRGLGIQVETTI